MYKILHIPTGEFRFFIDSYINKAFRDLISDCCERGTCPKEFHNLRSCVGCCWYDEHPNEAEYLIEKIGED